VEKKNGIFRYIVDNFEEDLMAFFIGLMTVMLFLQVGSRYIMSRPLIFTEEASIDCFIWVASLGLALATKNKSHLAIRFFVQKLLSQKAQALLEIIISMVAIGIFVFFIPHSIRYCIFVKPLISPALRLSKMVIAISLPIAYGLTIIRYIVVLVEDIKNIRE